MARRVTVRTELGPGRLVIEAADREAAVLVLGHGAGGGIASFDLDALAAELPPRGVTVVRYEQPWVVAGRKVAGPPKSLDLGWDAAMAAIAKKWPSVPIVVGGRSAGARVACRFAARASSDIDLRGVVALAFPLHPPGKPEKTRVDEISAVELPVLVIQGATDPFGTPDELDAALADNAGPRTLVAIDGAAHSLQPGKRSDPETGRAKIVDAVKSFVDTFISPAR